MQCRIGIRTLPCITWKHRSGTIRWNGDWMFHSKTIMNSMYSRDFVIFYRIKYGGGEWWLQDSLEQSRSRAFIPRRALQVEHQHQTIFLPLAQLIPFYVNPDATNFRVRWPPWNSIASENNLVGVNMELRCCIGCTRRPSLWEIKNRPSGDHARIVKGARHEFDSFSGM